MKKNIIILLLFSISILGSCTSSDSDKRYFNGDIKYINTRNTVKQSVTSQPLSLEGHTSGIIATYDSLLFCWSPDRSHFFNVFNINTGEELGMFCNKGRANNESISLGCIYNLFEEDGDIKSWLYAPAEQKLMGWNISRSLRENRTLFDTILPYNNYRILFNFYHSENTLMVYIPADEKQSGEMTTPYYEKRTIYTNERVCDYPLYNVNTLDKIYMSSPLYSWDSMKPDGSKIVQAMKNIAQINILDLSTGELTGYRLADGGDFSILDKSPEVSNIYYKHVHADDNYIYATFIGEQADDRSSVMGSSNVIHIYDWDGNLLYELSIDRDFIRIWVDSKGDRLYFLDANSEDPFYIDLIDIKYYEK